MEEFKQGTALEYYKNHLEEYNKDFRLQMAELKDGNLFFDIMMKEVWGRAQSDTSGQLNYYKQHLKKYTWTNSADAVIFYCGDEETAKNIRDVISKSTEDWKQAIENFNDRSTSDSGRFEIAKIPGIKNSIPANGLLTAVEKNMTDNSASFALLLKTYEQPSQKNFTEAKGDVITDYQDELDIRWVNALKKKYPVVIDQKVLSSILK